MPAKIWGGARGRGVQFALQKLDVVVLVVGHALALLAYPGAGPGHLPPADVNLVSMSKPENKII